MDAVLRKIGEGSYGDVYLIEHIDKKKEVRATKLGEIASQRQHFSTRRSQFVVKQIELGDASEKERKAAEQEVGLVYDKTVWEMFWLTIPERSSGRRHCLE